MNSQTNLNSMLKLLQKFKDAHSCQHMDTEVTASIADRLSKWLGTDHSCQSSAPQMTWCQSTIWWADWFTTTIKVTIMDYYSQIIDLVSPKSPHKDLVAMVVSKTWSNRNTTSVVTRRSNLKTIHQLRTRIPKSKSSRILPPNLSPLITIFKRQVFLQMKKTRDRLSFRSTNKKSKLSNSTESYTDVLCSRVTLSSMLKTAKLIGRKTLIHTRSTPHGLRLPKVQ